MAPIIVERGRTQFIFVAWRCVHMAKLHPVSVWVAALCSNCLGELQASGGTQGCTESGEVLLRGAGPGSQRVSVGWPGR